MTATLSSQPVTPGTDLRQAFCAAYENRYTWDPGFAGYQGRCLWQDGERQLQGRFQVGADLKATVEGIDDAEVHKAMAGQLWEVAIHRVRRPFEQTHAENMFTAGGTDATGVEVIVGGKGEGDRYRIQDDVVTMVHRHIHGTVVTIHTESVTHTGRGYLSRTYTSQYSDPASGEPRGGLNRFCDTFVPLGEAGPWVLSERVVETEAHGDTPAQRQVFCFEELAPLG
ncbi:MAG: DUF3386 domain-containing protein [Cyanobium sp.]